MILTIPEVLIDCNGLELDLHPLTIAVCSAMLPGLEIFSERIAKAVADHWGGSMIIWENLGLPTDGATMEAIRARITGRANAIYRFGQLSDPDVQLVYTFFRISTDAEDCAAQQLLGRNPRPISELTIDRMPPALDCPREFCYCFVEPLSRREVASYRES